jgi:hypothetical protein
MRQMFAHMVREKMIKDDVGMAPKHHPAPLSGGDRKAPKKELSKSRAMTKIFAERSAEKRHEGEALIRESAPQIHQIIGRFVINFSRLQRTVLKHRRGMILRGNGCLRKVHS